MVYPIDKQMDSVYGTVLGTAAGIFCSRQEGIQKKYAGIIIVRPTDFFIIFARLL